MYLCFFPFLTLVLKLKKKSEILPAALTTMASAVSTQLMCLDNTASEGAFADTNAH